MKTDSAHESQQLRCWGMGRGETRKGASALQEEWFVT